MLLLVSQWITNSQLIDELHISSYTNSSQHCSLLTNYHQYIEQQYYSRRIASMHLLFNSRYDIICFHYLYRIVSLSTNCSQSIHFDYTLVVYRLLIVSITTNMQFVYQLTVCNPLANSQSHINCVQLVSMGTNSQSGYRLKNHSLLTNLLVAYQIRILTNYRQSIYY